MTARLPVDVRPGTRSTGQECMADPGKRARSGWQWEATDGSLENSSAVGWDQPLWAQAHRFWPDRAKHGGPAVQSDLVPPYELLAAEV